MVAADGGAPAQDFPASYKGVIGIMGSDDLNGGPPCRPAAAPSRRWPRPAVDILTTVPHGSYDFFSGSSFAAAQVSGIAALLLEKNPKLTPPQLAAIIHKTAHPLARRRHRRGGRLRRGGEPGGTGRCDVAPP